jgi:hypothetical protein
VNAWAGYRDPTRRAQAAAGAPVPALPLTQPQALERAVELRLRGWLYPAIRDAMGYYHGHWASRDAWAYRVERTLEERSAHRLNPPGD